jgi:D-alanyl-D-alanine carboxypeptidase/D-alanyl-D-alanine-endopeptidase (penicillin-binding protein 4)
MLHTFLPILSPRWLSGAFLLLGLLFPLIHYAQTPALTRLSREIERLQSDPDMRPASWGVAVVEVRSGKLLASHDPYRSLTTASTMKAITTATALEVLGADFRFETTLAYDGKINDSILVGNLYLVGDGDPTLGSDRFGAAYELDAVLNQWVQAVKAAGIRQVQGAVIGDASIFSTQLVPAKWPWEDIGNYYGAGAAGLNIHENTYRIDFRSKRPGTLTDILRTEPVMDDLSFTNEVMAGPAGSGDQAYIYGAPYTTERYVRGSIPPNRSSFSVKGSMSDPARSTAAWLREELIDCGITVVGPATTVRQLWAKEGVPMTQRKPLHTFRSPTLSDIVRETNFKSVNLFAEALAKRLAVKLDRAGSTEAAVDAITDHWQRRGVGTQGLTLRDGSGLSPNNGVSALQMAQILAKAEQGSAGTAFYASLPIAGRSGTLSNMLQGTAAEGILRAKSGFISGVRSYAGYVDLPDGRRVAFAMIANQFACGPGEMRSKLERLMAALAEGT